ncbi:MAG: hypothetical protein NC432_08630 [Roseburia sp.]|nr:hypothetical protein [Roseburia sp.]MCM1097823.1 hypothetical protein [Ruminococcus flavefaciens]
MKKKMYVPRKYFVSQEVSSKLKRDDIGAKLDKTILHVADCILKTNGKRADNIAEMAKALAELVQARAYAEHLICLQEEQ